MGNTWVVWMGYWVWIIFATFLFLFIYFFISSFYCATISAFKTNDSSLSPFSFFFLLISTFQSSSYFIFFSFFLLQFKSHTTSLSVLTILACQIRSKNRGKFNFHGPSSKLSFNNSQYIPSNFFLKLARAMSLWPYRGSVPANGLDIRKQTLINMILTSDPQLYFLPHEL